MKKFTSLLLCLALLLAMASPVLATDGEGGGDGDSGSASVPHEHSWSVTDTATCTQAGKITKVCSGCNESTEEDSPAKGHSWTTETITAAGCTNDGQDQKTCSRCSAVETVTVPKTGHQYGQWMTTAETHSRICTNDGCLVEDAQNGSHSWKTVVTKQATCKEEGSQKNVCTVCAYETTPTAIAKLTTHTYDNVCDPDCNVCGAARDASHTFTSTWSNSYSSHWHECTKCGEKKDEAAHVPGPAATEDAPQVCLKCSYVITAKKQHTHSYGTEWTSDELGHWHACAKCDEEKDYADHTYDDDCDDSCNTCGYKRTDAHVYDTEGWLSNNFEHWNVCTLCGQESDREKHIAGPEATEKEAQLCTVCGFELAPVLDHDHDFGLQWEQDEYRHWQVCDCGEESVPEAHVWNGGKKNRNKTVTYTCEVCGYEKTEAAASSGVSWILVVLIILALLCAGGIVVLVVLLRRGVFDGDRDEGEEYGFLTQEDLHQEEVDEDDQMIDDFFASLEEDLYS